MGVRQNLKQLVAPSVDSEDISESCNKNGKVKLTETDHKLLIIEAKTYLKACEKELPQAPSTSEVEQRKVEDIDLVKFKNIHDKR